MVPPPRAAGADAGREGACNFGGLDGLRWPTPRRRKGAELGYSAVVARGTGAEAD
jgi:hypothetical protein